MASKDVTDIPCKTEGCEKMSTSRTAGLCPACYSRKRRSSVSTHRREHNGLRGKYTEEDRDAAMLSVVMNGGSIKRGAEAAGIPRDTVKEWVTRYATRYEELREKHGPALERRVVSGLLDFMEQAEEVKRAALARTLADLQSEEGVRDASTAMKNIAISQGIAGTKMMELMGRPTSIIEHRSPNELLSRLRALGAIIEGTAEDLEPPAASLEETNPDVAAAGGLDEAAQEADT